MASHKKERYIQETLQFFCIFERQVKRSIIPERWYMVSHIQMNDIVSSTPETHTKELELLANIFIRSWSFLTGSFVAGCPRLRGATPPEKTR